LATGDFPVLNSQRDSEYPQVADRGYEWLNQGADKQQELLLLKYLHWQEILEHCH
jgi:hypothetical protein